MTPTDRASAALALRALGLPVIPLHAPEMPADGLDAHNVGKVPLLRSWKPYQERLPTLAEVREWWRRWPTANLALVTGPLPEGTPAHPGIVAIDFDPGAEPLLPAVERHMPVTWTAKTGRGGRHYLFKHPAYRVHNAVGILPGVDVRAGGGYIVAAPSVSAFGSYEWVEGRSPFDVELADVPPWLITYLRIGNAVRNGHGATNGHHEPFRLPRTIPDGERNATLFRFARSQRANGVPRDMIAATLAAVNRHACVPPLDDAEVASIVESAWTRDDEPDFRPAPHVADDDDTTASVPTITPPTAPELKPLAALAMQPRSDALEAALKAVATLTRKVDPLRRAILRNDAVRWLDGLKVPGAAKLVDAALRLGQDADVTDAQGAEIVLKDVEPWPQPVDGPALCAEIEAGILRFLVLPPHASVGVTLWSLLAHAHDAFTNSPLLALYSPVPRCGKSLLLSIVERLVPRVLLVTNLTAATIFRAIPKYRPTLLIDEADTYLKHTDEMRGLLNGSFTKSTAFVLRTVGDEHEPRLFSTWCAKAVALIGKLPATLHDRAVVVPMKRRAPGEQVEAFRERKLHAFEPLRRKAARWAKDHLATLKTVDPEVPPGLDDRAADCWRPLLAIAELVGGDWPERARAAALALSGGEAKQDDGVAAVQLLADIRALFVQRMQSKVLLPFNRDRIAGADLAETLGAMDDRPWAEFRRGKAITQPQLTRLLRGFGVKSRAVKVQMKIAGETRTHVVRGYTAAMFADAFERYLPPLSSETASTEIGEE